MRAFSFQFILVSLLLFTLHPISQSAEPNEPTMQGAWFGDGVHPLNQNVLIINNDEFVLITPLGAFKSTFDVRHEEPLNGITIKRYDGDMQFGIFKLDKTKLYLKLAAPGKPRPTLADVTFPSGKPHWHLVFDRRPTPEGRAVLKKYLTQSVETAMETAADKTSKTVSASSDEN